MVMDGNMVSLPEFPGKGGAAAEKLAAKVINGELLVIMFLNITVDLADQFIFGQVHAVAECDILGTDFHYGYQGVYGTLSADRNPGNGLFQGSRIRYQGKGFFIWHPARVRPGFQGLPHHQITCEGAEAVQRGNRLVQSEMAFIDMELFLFPYTSKSHSVVFHTETHSLRMLLDQSAETSQFMWISGNFMKIGVINADAETGYMIKLFQYPLNRQGLFHRFLLPIKKLV